MNHLESSRSSQVSPIPRQRLVKGLQYFSMLTVIGIAAIFYTSSTPETFDALRHLDYRYILLAAILQGADIWLGGFRNHVLIKKFKTGITSWLTFRAQLANEFGAAVTPGQSGGLPAWLYILKRGGVSPARAMAVSVLVFLSTLVFFELSTSFSWMALGERLGDTTFQYLLKYGFIISTALLLAVLLSVWMPQPLRNLLNSISDSLLNSRSKWRIQAGKAIGHVTSAMQQYQSSFKHFLRHDRRAVVQAFSITSVYYFGKLNLAYLIILGMGVQVDYLTAMAVLALLRFVLYFSPTPGGSGVAEISIAALMSLIMPAYLLPIYAILYRAFHLYFPAAFGAWVLFSEFRRGVNIQFTSLSNLTNMHNQTVEV